MDIKIDNKSVLITGGTGSIGMALVELFSQNGGDVLFQYNKNDQRAHDIEKKTGAKSTRIDFLGNDPLPNKIFDIIVNSAGINITKNLSHEIDDAEWDRTIDINMSAPFHIIRKYLPYMIKSKWGRIINISSIYGLRGTTNNLPYNASKHGLSGLTKTIAKEYAQYGITCNEICPGPIESELMQRIAKEKERTLGIPAEKYLNDARQWVPAHRMAQPVEVASLALYLASDLAGYINGVSIPIDGALIA
jgi:3-hydroxybutyrate dehydrogenase